jgi:surface antigen
MRTFQGAHSAPTLAAACFLAASIIPAGPVMSGPAIASPEPAASAPSHNVSRRPDDSLSLPELQARLDNSDQVAVLHALHMALNNTADGGTFIWQKTDRDLKGVIKPTSAFRNAHGQVCRHVIYAIALGRYRKQIEFVACREAGDRWRL